MNPQIQGTADTSTKDILAVFSFVGGLCVLLLATEPLPAMNLLTAVQKMFDGKLDRKEVTAIWTVGYLTVPATLTLIGATLWVLRKEITQTPYTDYDRRGLVALAVGGFIVGNWIASAIGSIVVPVVIDIRQIHGGPESYWLLLIIAILIGSYLTAYGLQLAVASVLVGISLGWALVRSRIVQVDY
jgi:hypothetical protein